MKHFLNATMYGSFLGMLKEKQQAFKGSPSAHNPQDYYSNNLGNSFRKYMYSIFGDGYVHCSNISVYMYNFLTSFQLRGGQ